MHVTIITPFPFRGSLLHQALKRENIKSLTFSPSSLSEDWSFNTDLALLPHHLELRMWKDLRKKIMNSSKTLPIVLFGEKHSALYKLADKKLLERCVFIDHSISLDHLPKLIREMIGNRLYSVRASRGLKYKSYTLLKDQRSLVIGKKKYLLRKKEYFLLELLMSHPGQVITREHMIDTVWDKRSYVAQNTIDVYIHRLRKTLKPYSHHNPIRTIPCLGYVFTNP